MTKIEMGHFFMISEGERLGRETTELGWTNEQYARHVAEDRFQSLPGLVERVELRRYSGVVISHDESTLVASFSR